MNLCMYSREKCSLLILDIYFKGVRFLIDYSFTYYNYNFLNTHVKLVSKGIIRSILEFTLAVNFGALCLKSNLTLGTMKRLSFSLCILFLS